MTTPRLFPGFSRRAWTVLVAGGILGAFCSSAPLALAEDEESMEPCTFHVLADDEFKLSINGVEMFSGKAWDRVLKKDLPLKQGDVVSLVVKDNQGGRDGRMAIVITRGSEVIADSKKFRYSVKPDEDFATAPDVKGLKIPEWGKVGPSFGLGRGNQPPSAWLRKSDRDNGTVHFRWIYLE